MSPLYSLHHFRSELQTRLTTTADPLLRSVLSHILSRTTARITSLTALHHASVIRSDRQLKSFNGRKTIQVSEAPIKCGLRNSKEHLQVKHTAEHWFWNRLHDTEAKKLARVQLALQELFFTTPSNTLIRIVFLHGSLPKALKSAGLESFTQTPREVRRTHGVKLLQMLEEGLVK